MKRSVYKFSLICGLFMTLAAFPVFAQNSEIQEVQVNKKPLEDRGQNILEKARKHEINLKTPFSLTMRGKLDERGKFDGKTVEYTKNEGDEQIIAVAKQAIEAANDSGIFNYLKQSGINEVELSLVQTDTEFSANLKSTLKTENHAKSVNSGINLFIQTGKITVKDENSKALLENSKAEIVGKDFLLKFSMPIEQFHGMINRELEKVKQ